MLNQMPCLVLMAFKRTSDYALFIPSKYILIFDAAFTLRCELHGCSMHKCFSSAFRNHDTSKENWELLIICQVEKI